MADYRSMQQGLRIIADEAMPSVTSSTQIFANAPEGTRAVLLTIRGATLTLRMSGGLAATAGGNGHDYAPGATYEFALNKSSALEVRAIQSGGTATGWISYLGL